jgi:hypothetical protein
MPAKCTRRDQQRPEHIIHSLEKKGKGFYDSLGDLAPTNTIPLFPSADRLTEGSTLTLIGSWKEIDDMLAKANQSPNMKFNNPPGLFLGIYKHKKLIGSDVLVVQFISGDAKDPDWDPSKVDADDSFLAKTKTAVFAWRKITDELKCDELPGEVSIHPFMLGNPLWNFLLDVGWVKAKWGK